MSTAFRPGTLASAMKARIATALANGALRPIVTEQVVVEQDGVRYLVRAVSSLAHKDEDPAARKAAPANPFQPWEPDLFVADVSETHVALLNKFPVLDRHLLIVTRRFVHQETLLDEDDFAAVARCLSDIDGLCFYNGGESAGASQPHKHMQLVPLPLAADGPALPVQPLLDAAHVGANATGNVPGFDFLHAFCWLSDLASATLLARSRDLMREIGMSALPGADSSRKSTPYNLLLTRDWMLLVPRSREHWEDVSVNALGYAGSLFVRNAAQLDAVRKAGPMAVLRHVSVPAY